MVVCWTSRVEKVRVPAGQLVGQLKVHQVYQVSKQHNVPIIGQGGVTSVNDALEFIIAGSASVGIGTALFYDPLICPKINQGIVDYLKKHNMKNVSELVGTLELHDNGNEECSG